jgi:hypothetical protein
MLEQSEYVRKILISFNAVSKLRRELRNKKFNRKLRASCECNGRGVGILPTQTSVGYSR